MSFMEKQIVYDRWIVADTNQGTEAIPFDIVFNTQNKKTMHPTFNDLKDYLQGNHMYSVEIIDGYGARLSAPGYLDCTEWSVFRTEQEAKDYLDETFPEESEEI